MKNITASLLSILFLCIKSNSQITKGNWLMGGDFLYNKSRSKGNDAIISKVRTIDVMPNIGYFVHDKLATGIKLNAQLSKHKYPQIDGSTIMNIQNYCGVGPFIRYYFLNIDNRVNVFSDASAFYSLISGKSTGRTKDKSKEFGYAAFAGAVVFLNTSVGLEFLLGYNNYKTLEIDAKGDAIQFKIGFQFHLEKE